MTQSWEDRKQSLAGKSLSSEEYGKRHEVVMQWRESEDSRDTITTPCHNIQLSNRSKDNRRQLSATPKKTGESGKSYLMICRTKRAMGSHTIR